MEIGWGNWNKRKKVCKDGNVCRGRKCVFGDRKYKELDSITLPEQKVNIWDEKEFIETHTQNSFLFFLLYLHFHLKCWFFCCRECKETKFFHIFSPPNTHFPPKTCISVLLKPFLSLFQFPQTICIDALFIGWFIWRSQKWLTFTSNIFYSKGFPVFHHNLCANGANCNVYRAWFGSSATLRNTNIVEELTWYARLRPKSRNIFEANLLLCELQKFGGL